MHGRTNTMDNHNIRGLYISTGEQDRAHQFQFESVQLHIFRSLFLPFADELNRKRTVHD